MAGEYRKLLKDTPFAHVRLALTSQPIIGVNRREDLTPALIELFNGMDDPVAKEKVEQLRSGACVPVTYRETPSVERHYAPGELFLRS